MKNELEPIINKVWEEDIVKDLSERNIMWYEATFVACFYYHLRRRIEEDIILNSTYKIYLEHSHPDIPGSHFDIVIKKLNNGKKWVDVPLWEQYAGTIVVVIEFKPLDEINYKTNKNDVKKWKADLKKLSSLELTKDSEEVELLYFFYTSSLELPPEFYKDIKEKWFESRFRIGKGIFDDPYNPKKYDFEVVSI